MKKSNSLILKCFAISIFSVLAVEANAQVNYRTTRGAGDWSGADNWSLERALGSSDKLRFSPYVTGDQFKVNSYTESVSAQEISISDTGIFAGSNDAAFQRISPDLSEINVNDIRTFNRTPAVDVTGTFRNLTVNASTIFGTKKFVGSLGRAAEVDAFC